jgi:tetratricopeptide (TPR) repeat protein
MIVSDASDAGSGSSRSSSSGGFGSSQSAGGGNTLAADPFGNRMMNCALRASVAGFTSDTVDLFNRKTADSPDVGTIVLHRIAGVEGSSISVTSMMAPKDAKKAYEHGLQSLLKNKLNDAAKDFEKAVAVYPNYADAWVSLGKVRLEQQSIEPARAALKRAMESDAKLVAPYVELGLLAAKDANWQESGKYLDRAVELDPVDFPQAWYADAVANYNLKKYDAAEKSAREAMKLDPRHANPRSGYLLGLVLAEKKDYPGAAAELTAYMKLAPNAPDLAQAKDQLGQIEKLMGATK